jgi:hypothetical protein
MSPEKQRIAIAEACGFNRAGNYWCAPTGRNQDLARDGNGLPDYLNDLNAMHEAEDGLSEEQAEKWLHEMLNIVWRPEIKSIAPSRGGWLGLTAYELPMLLKATAAQRAEAFLRTLNLWTE